MAKTHAGMGKGLDVCLVPETGNARTGTASYQCVSFKEHRISCFIRVAAQGQLEAPTAPETAKLCLFAQVDIAMELRHVVVRCLRCSARWKGGAKEGE